MSNVRHHNSLSAQPRPQMKTHTSWLRRFPLFSAIASVAALSACAVPFPVYTVSSANVATIRSSERSIELGTFAGDTSYVSCRLNQIQPEGGKTFAQYIRSAFNDELVIAGNSSTKPKVPLNVKLFYIDVSCNSTDSRWEIDLEVTLPGRDPFTVKTLRRFDYNFLGGVMLPRAYQAFVPTVQEAVANVLAHPEVRRAQSQ